MPMRLCSNEADPSRDALIRQVTGAVKWEQSMRVLIAQGVQTFVEVGPGKVLCGLMRQIDRSKICVNVADEASLHKTLEQFAAMSAQSSTGLRDKLSTGNLSWKC